MLVFIFVASSLCGLTIALYLSVFWSTHLEMNKSSVGWLNNKEFREKFSQVEWEEEDTNHTFSSFGGRSLWKRGDTGYDQNELHASIVQFNGEQYRLFPHTFIFASILIKRTYPQSKSPGFFKEIIRRIKGKDENKN